MEVIRRGHNPLYEMQERVGARNNMVPPATNTFKVYPLFKKPASISSVFDGLERGVASENSEAYKTLSNRLSSLLGNLLELHSEIIPKEGAEIQLPNTPMLSLIIDTWETDGKHAYCLAGCDELKKL
ncbi:hypothetical protein C0992_010003 [Termitomyces sp. T32_za158]|nr:hypothetical protein C0992_010003 [Termitomyces sp. T32_za158]